MKTYIKLLTIISIIILISLTGFAEDNTLIEVTEGDLVTLEITASDLDNDELYYTYDPPLDSEGKWQTTYGDYGDYQTQVTVSDGQFNTVKEILIRVNKANWPPVLEEIDDIFVNEQETVIIEPEAYDEEGDAITYTISEPVGNDGVWETTYNDAGEYSIRITATDNQHEIVAQDLLIIVEDLNREPEITEYSPKKDNVEINEGEEVTFFVSVEDPDEDDLTYSWELNGEEVSTSEDFTYFPDYESEGEYILEVIISDGDSIIDVLWDINVINVDRPPVLNKIDSIMVNEGELIILNFVATDPDGDDVRYTISEPVGDNKEWQTTYDDAGTYEIEVIISDGENFVSQIFNIIVKNVDRAPEFPPLDTITITEEQELKINLNAVDPDGDIISYSAQGMPPGAELIGNKFSFKPTYETFYKPKNWVTSVLKFLHMDNIAYGNKKVFLIKFTASGKEKSVSQYMKLIIKDVNRPPVLVEMNEIYSDEGELIKVIPKAVEYDNDRVKFYISKPVGNDGMWQTSYVDSGEYPLEIMASDGKTSDTGNVLLTVKNVNRNPVFKKIKSQEVREGETIEIKPIIRDADNDEIQLSIASLPHGAELIDGKFVWTPSHDVVKYRDGTGGYKIVFEATDGEAIIKKNITITVKDVNRAPYFINTTPANSIKVYTGTPVTFYAEVNDLDNDELTYSWKSGLFSSIEADTPAIRRKFTSSGNKKITLIVSDGVEKISKTWKVEVLNRPVKKIVRKQPLTVVKKPIVKQTAPIEPAPEPVQPKTYKLSVI